MNKIILLLIFFCVIADISSLSIARKLLKRRKHKHHVRQFGDVISQAKKADQEQKVNSEGFTYKQCQNAVLEGEPKLQPDQKMIQKLAAWEKMWEAHDFTPNPQWSYQGHVDPNSKSYHHEAIDNNDQEAKKEYCQRIGKKPSPRTDDSEGVIGTKEDDPKWTPHFFSAPSTIGGGDNADLNLQNWENLPICLGFAEDIDKYIEENRNNEKKICKKLLSWYWTEQFNMRFIYCIAHGYLGTGGYLWTTAADKSNKINDDGSIRNGADRVTGGETCLAASLKMSWPDSKYPCSFCQSKNEGFCPEKCNKKKQNWARSLSQAKTFTKVEGVQDIGNVQPNTKKKIKKVVKKMVKKAKKNSKRHHKY